MSDPRTEEEMDVTTGKMEENSRIETMVNSQIHFVETQHSTRSRRR